ncbi:MAG: signal recognition particle-docking protein FtsY [Bacillota bacterium]|jgi:fused signal recognition particle receptor
MGFFEKLQKGLLPTRGNLLGKVGALFSGQRISDDLYDELEEALIQADVGVTTSCFLVDQLRCRVKGEKISDPTLLQGLLEEEITSLLQKSQAGGLQPVAGRLNIWVMVGVNGAGKTTTIGKLAAAYSNQGQKVLLAAADTFRAAAAEQLQEWASRAGVDLIKQGQGADPAAVVFDACRAALSRKADILIIDTAGRLQNKINLMEELKKIGKVITREAGDAHVEKILVLDAGTGQNAISQAKMFGEVIDLSGVILTKLDGTAKGGSVCGIVNESNLPVRMIGVGEGIDDLQPFVAEEFAKALFE